MGNYAEWRAADVSTSGSSRCAVRDYYDRCDQSTHITVTMPASAEISRGLQIAVGWLARWVVCAMLFWSGYLALGLKGHYVVPGAIAGGVSLGNLVRYAEWRFGRKEESWQ